MAIKRVDVHILYCGQGMTNWIEYFEDEANTVPTATALVDIGGGGTNSERAAEFIAGRLLGFPSANRKIGALIISHQDRDHWNLIDYLRSLIKDSGVTCGRAYLGGAMWAQAAKESVFKFCKKTGAKPVFLPRLSSAYVKNRYLPLLSKPPFRLQLVIANVPSAYSTPGLIKNGTSAVVAVELIGSSQSVILPGDATFETMAVMNKIYASGKRPLPCYGLSVPHHGSLATSVQGYASKKKTKDMNFKIVNKFSSNLNTTELVASAGPRNRHHHPMLQIVQVFETNCTAAKSDHYLQTFDFNSTAWTMPVRKTPVWTTTGYKKVKDSSGHLVDQLDLADYVLSLKTKGAPTLVRRPLRSEPAEQPPPPTAAPPSEAELATHAARLADAAG